MLNGNYYALKIIPKYNLKTKGKINTLLNEPNILLKLNKSNFIPEIISSFQDFDNMYLVTSFYEGPSLIKISYKKLTEEQIKFISACIIQSLKYLREKEIIHRDLTPQNIIMDKDNYFNLIDFSFSINYSLRYYNKFKCITYHTITPPEIMNESEYDYNSDYYRLGNIIFFLVFKKYPLYIKQSNNLTGLLEKFNYTKYYSKEFIYFLSGLLNNNIKKRLGYNSIHELLNHSWFNKFDWEKLENRQIISPIDKNKFIIKKPICKIFVKTKKDLQNYAKISKEKYFRLFLEKFEFPKY